MPGEARESALAARNRSRRHVRIAMEDQLPRPGLLERVPRVAAPVLVQLGALVVLVLIAVAGPAPALAVLVAGLVAAALLWRPQWSLYLCVVAAFTVLPAAVPSTFLVAGYTFYPFEPFLGIAFVWTLLRFRAPLWGNVAVGALLLVLVGWAAVGLVGGNDPSRVVFDVRPLAHLSAASTIAVRVAGTGYARRTARLVAPILWFSAVLMVLASTTGLAISGTAEQATLYLDAATSDATRLRGPATDLAMVVLCACAALFLLKRSRPRTLLLLSIPSFLIVFLAFSRYTIFGLAFAVVFAVVTGFSFRTAFRTVATAVVVLAAALGLGIASPALATVPGGDWVASQVDGFQSRVLGGLTSQVIDADGSAQYRVREDENLIPQIAASPVLGHGFGFAYKAPEPPAGSFFATYGPYYAHNYYLWLLVKTGIAGAAVMLGTLFAPVVLSFRRRDATTTSLAVAVGALLATSFAAPMPNGDLSGTLLGGCFGLLVAQLSGSAGRYVLIRSRGPAERARTPSASRPSAGRRPSTPFPPRSGIASRAGSSRR